MYRILILVNLLSTGIIFSSESTMPVYFHNTVTPAVSNNAGGLTTMLEFAGNDETRIISSIGVPKLGANVIFRFIGSNLLGSYTFGEKSNTPVLYAPQLGCILSRKFQQGSMQHFGYLPQPGIRDSSGAVVQIPVVNGLIYAVSWPFGFNNVGSGMDYITAGVYLPVNSSLIERISVFANSKFPIGKNSSLYWTANYDAISSSSLIAEMDTGIVSFLVGCDAMFQLNRQTTLSRFIAIKVFFN